MNIEKKLNKLIIISSPSGAGKTTICKFLLKKIKNVELSISYTTRHKRINEINGKHYYFIDMKKFFSLKKKNYFIDQLMYLITIMDPLFPALKKLLKVIIIFYLILIGKEQEN